MKRTILVAAVLMLGLAACNSNNSKENPNATPPVVAEGGLKLAYVNIDTINAHYQYILDLEAEIKALSETKQKSLKQQMDQLQKDAQKAQTDFQKYLSNATSLTLTQQQAKEAEFKKLEASIQQRAERLSQLEQEYAAQVAERSAAEHEKMLAAVHAYIREYNAANQQFDIIYALSSGAGSPILYGNPSLDITKEILDGLNEEYRNLKKD